MDGIGRRGGWPGSLPLEEEEEEDVEESVVAAGTLPAEIMVACWVSRRVMCALLG